ncbi:MAG: hypothetical protein AAB447_04040 [Patescibacteria group bacterium]
MSLVSTVYAAINANAADPLISKVLEFVVNPLIQFLFGVAVLYFLWGVFKFIKDSEDTTARSEGQQHMLWGVVGIVIMVSAYGLINFIQATIAPIGA